MQVIQAKPTRFRGVQYRSRLEATWAVLFNKLGLVFDYEDSTLAGGSKWQFDDGYCPDFRLGDMKIEFVEVKPIIPNNEYIGKLRRAAVSVGHLGYHISLFVGSLRGEEIPAVYEYPYHRPSANFGSWLMVVMGASGKSVMEAHKHAQSFRWDLHQE